MDNDSYKIGDDVILTIGGQPQQATVEHVASCVYVVWFGANGRLERAHLGPEMAAAALSRVAVDTPALIDALTVAGARLLYRDACEALDIDPCEHEDGVLSATERHMVSSELWDDISRAIDDEPVHSPDYYRFLTEQLPDERALADDAELAEERAASSAALDNGAGMTGAEFLDALATAAPSLTGPAQDVAEIMCVVTEWDGDEASTKVLFGGQPVGDASWGWAWQNDEWSWLGDGWANTQLEHWLDANQDLATPDDVRAAACAAIAEYERLHGDG